ncbi:hypothetical protein PybrP1_002527 [[Pythium] brassicae (nom. inval.)]|nr:hypothetical protein PybrP1_002527 [[Pythium] brassicae (nom. inval.)]
MKSLRTVSTWSCSRTRSAATDRFLLPPSLLPQHHSSLPPVFSMASLAPPKPNGPCRFADQCRNQACYFSHPSGPLCPSFPQRCTDTRNCASRHPATSATGIVIQPATMTAPAPRPLCKNGDACTFERCKFLHPGGILCKFYPKCRSADGAACGFRHPFPEAQPPVERVEATYQPFKPKDDAARYAKQPSPPKFAEPSPGKPRLSPAEPRPKPARRFQDRVARALLFHDRIIAKEEHELKVKAAEASRRAVGGVDSQDVLTNRAMAAKLEELRCQREVFVEVASRLERDDFQAGMAPLPEAARVNILKREIYRLEGRLPALAKRLEIEAHLSSTSTRFTVIQGQTGSGKSTQIPQYAADLPFFAGKRVICTQPRKIAATSLAARVAFEYSAGWDKATVGGDVGVRAGGRFKASKRTRIEYVTEAVLLEMIARARRDASANPFDDVGCVIVDEAHERSITCDLIMGSLKEDHAKWCHVKVAITSATIDLNLFSGFFDRAPVVEIPGRMFPVEVQYVSAGGKQSGAVSAANVATVVSQCALMIQQTFPDPTDGDILCFVPGQDDVLRAKDLFDASLARLLATSSADEQASLQRVQCHTLYGKQDPDEQALVFKKQPGARKVIFSTDVAETSVTIDGVVFVVDSGLRKAMVYDPVRNMSSLKVHAVSRSSALQRCGRAGRTRPGKCFRLYAQEEFDDMEIGNAAEIFQQPLTLALLTLHHVGIRPREFHWIESPSADAVERAEAELGFLGALDARGGVTPLGRLVAEVQIDPKLVRLVDRAAHRGITQVGVDLVAVLSVANIAYYRGNKNDKASKGEAEKKREALLVPDKGDVVALYRTYRAWRAVREGWGMDNADDALAPPKVANTDMSDGEDGDGEADEVNDDDLMASLTRGLLQLKAQKTTVAAANDSDSDNDDNASVVSSDIGGDNADDDDDTRSVVSVGNDTWSVASGMSAATKKKPKQRVDEKRARAWCIQNGVNAKAMGIAMATAKELLRTLSRAKAWPHGVIDSDAAARVDASDDQLRRLLTAGFFLNAAVNKPTPATAYRRGGPQYYALYSSVLGSLFMGSALHVDEKRGGMPAPWILFDSILRLNTTTFLSLATPIDEAWIKDESPAFYALCSKNRAELPVQTIEYPSLSVAVLKGLFGKSFQQINRWEAQLQCTLSIDRGSGTLTVFCAPRHEAQIRASLEKRFSALKTRLESEAREEVYLGETRAVVGAGFQVQQLLFGDEFTAVTVRNLPSLSDLELEQRMLAWTRAAGCSADVVRSIDVLRNSADNSNPTMSATVKFVSKDAASKVYETMRGDTSGACAGDSLAVTPLRKMGERSSVSADFAGRIKLTWADGEATGDAKVFFRTAHEANVFVRSARSILQSTTARVSAIGQQYDDAAAKLNSSGLAPVGRGDRTPSKGAVVGRNGADVSASAAPPLLAPLIREPIGANASPYRLVFDMDRIGKMPLEQQTRLRFSVSVREGVAPSVDEVELLEKIRRSVPGALSAKVARKPATEVTPGNNLELEVRFNRMLPLLTCLDETMIHTDFVDRGTRRAGVVVFCRDLTRLRETYELASASSLWGELEKPHSQPIRMEIEYSFTTALHADLFRCFRDQIAEIVAFARTRGAICQESQPTALSAAVRASKNMVTLKFLGDMAVLERIQAKLDESLHCEKVESEDIRVLFSITARRKIQDQMNRHMTESNATTRYFIRWLIKTNEFWVFGDAPSRACAVEWLHQLIAELKSLDVVDRLVRTFVKKDPKVKGLAAAAKEWLSHAPEARVLFHWYTMSDRMLYVSGSETQVAALTRALAAAGLLYQPRATNARRGDSVKPDCGVCYMTADEPAVVLTMCGHVFCTDCLQPMVQPATCVLPLVCPAPDCGQAFHMDDVAKLVNEDTLGVLLETSVFDFVMKHKDVAIICPKSSCNQILSTTSIIGSTDTAPVGGRTIHCDQCNADYCLECTNAAGGRAVTRHANLTCESFRAGQAPPQIAQHLRAIQEQILNMSCPNCRVVFLDFSGCTSVQCGNAACGHFFCANCLTFSSQSSGATHDHVQRCPQNPNPALGGIKGYFVSDEVLAATHRVLRSQKLEAYFRGNITSDATRHEVYKRLVQDLKDIGIDLPVSLRGSKAAGGADFASDEEEPAEVTTVRRHVLHVRERLLNLRCPKCKLVFFDFDFDTCAALTCANPHCAGGFCAYCLADCGADAHEHLRTCAKNPNQPYFYVLASEFHRAHKERREQLVRAYLHDVVRTTDGDDVGQRVKAELAADFRALGLDIAAIA